MMTIIDDEFKAKAPELFRALRERAINLKEPEVIANVILKLINEAESLLKSENISDSKIKYDQAQSKITTVEISQNAKPLAWKLFWIEIGYLVLLLLLGGCFTCKWPHFGLLACLTQDPTAKHLETFWFGALGGITIAIYGIYEHMHLRDFDPKYELWYVCKPLIGGIFGWFVFLIYYIGLVSVQGFDAKIKSPELPYLIAFLAGFSERFTLKMIDKLMSVLTTWEENAKSGTPKEKTPK